MPMKPATAAQKSTCLPVRMWETTAQRKTPRREEYDEQGFNPVIDELEYWENGNPHTPSAGSPDSVRSSFAAGYRE